MIATSFTPDTLLKSLEAAALALQDAHAEYAGATCAYAEAKRDLELARAKLLCEGIDGKNAEAREAKLRLELDHLYQALFEAETALTSSRCSLDCARLEWDAARYAIRALEVMREGSL